MPAISAPATVLVTGVSGFVGQHVARAYLQRGFSVRGTVRGSLAKGAGIRAIFDSAFPGQFELAVADILHPEELDAAAAGVAGIAHVASPITTLPPGADPQELIRPAVEGTLNVLRSAAKAGTVQRVVITGSVETLRQPHALPYTYSAGDWNDHAVEQVAQRGRAAPTPLKYPASKVLAERAANGWVREHSPAFDVAHVLPSWVFGPILENYASLETMFTTPRALFDIYREPRSGAALTTTQGGFVHVHDVARAHVDAHTRDELGGSRLILSSKTDVTFQEYYDAYWSLPDAERPKLPFEVTRGEPGRVADPVRDRIYAFDSEGAEAELGWAFTPLDVTVRDALGDIVKKLYSA